MRILSILATAFAVTLLLAACTAGDASGEIPTAQGEAGIARIATWNLEWFGALNRNADDIKQIAAIIRELDIDVLALEEIVCPCTVEALAAELGDYEFFISPQRIPQKLALMWRSERVGEVTFDEAAYSALRGVADTGLDRELRQPLVFRMKIDHFDFTLVVVHLKSIPEAERSVEIRNIQYDTLNAWLAQELGREGGERDIVIAGDFNSYNQGISSARLLEAGHVVFATTSLPDGEYSNIWYDREGTRNHSLIDHIALTPELRDGEFGALEAIRDWDVEIGGEAYENGVSDHLPLVAVFKTTEDID